MELVSDQGLSLNELVTYRAGEPAYDPYEGRVIMLAGEMIKIKGKKDSMECLFFEPDVNMCSIYSKRPVECRELKCWDTSAVRSLFLRDVLTRGAILGDNSDLRELINAYDRTFPPQVILQLVIAGGGKEPADLRKMKELDREFREKICSGMGISRGDLRFLFGRPVKELSLAFSRIVK